MNSMALLQLGWLLLVFTSLTRISLAEGTSPTRITLAEVPVDLPRLCYTAKNELAPSYLLPCFNGAVDDGDVYGCCIAGDYCLENQACYNKYSAITYQKGCTSSNYDGTKCPPKCNTDQSKADWVGLIHCNGTNETPKDTWVCQHPDNCFAPSSNCPLSGSAKWDPQLEITRPTYCENIKHDQKWVAVEGKMTIESTASLPLPSYVSAWWDVHSNYSTRWDSEASHSQTVSYIPTTPTGPALNTAWSAPRSSGQASSSNSTAVFPEEKSSPRGNKVGMAVGLGLGIPLFLAVMGFLIYFLRKHYSRGGTGDQSWLGTNSGDGAAEEKDVKVSANRTHDYSPKAELPADERAAQFPEMEGSSVDHKSPMVSPFLSKTSGKVDARDHQIETVPVYELPG